MGKYIRSVCRLIASAVSSPSTFIQALNMVSAHCEARRFASVYEERQRLPQTASMDGKANLPGKLFTYFQNNKVGPGIWKWLHYFEVYERHLAKFVDRPVVVLEIGIYSGGSLPMWQAYFGDSCHVHGVDIEPACRMYENERTTIWIGDQADRSFWASFKDRVGGVDIVIDDGGHTPEQQRVTLEELLPHIRPGGVYLCEDIHDTGNRFTGYVSGLADAMNDMRLLPDPILTSGASAFQTCVHSIHQYPYLTVVEKREAVQETFSCPKYGTEWQPFLDKSTESAQ